MDPKKEFSERLFELLYQGTGLNDKQLCQKLGVHRSTLIRWRAGDIPNFRNMLAICRNFSHLFSEEEWNELVEQGGFLYGTLPYRPSEITTTGLSEDTTSIIQSLISGTYLEGRVRILDKPLLLPIVSQNDINEFYNGAAPNWGIIVSNADVRRDQEEYILKELKSSVRDFNILCIVGEFGSGKSTLALRIAYEINQNQGATVIHLIDNSEPGFWYQLPGILAKLKKRVYILADDIFRYERVVQAVRDIEPFVPVTIISTSRPDKYRGDRRLGKPIKRIDLKELSQREKVDFLNKLGKSYEMIDIVQQDRVDQANTLLVLALETLGSKEFTEIIRDSLDSLYKNDEIVYRAYEYVCFSYQFGIAIPLSLLERLDPSGRFYDILRKDAAAGLLYAHKFENNFVCAKHERIAEVTLQFYFRDAKIVFRELVEAVDEKQEEHRKFICRLIAAAGKKPYIRDMLVSRPEQLNRIVAFSKINELYWLRQACQNQKLITEAIEYSNAILSGRPKSEDDCFYLLSECQWRNEERVNHKLEEKAILTVSRWMNSNPYTARIQYLYTGLHQIVRTRDNGQRVIKETAKWVVGHPEDIIVRIAYMALVRDKGTDTQVQDVICDTENWIRFHVEESYVRRHFIRLVARRGTPGQRQKARQEAEDWLKDHNNDEMIRTILIQEASYFNNTLK